MGLLIGVLLGMAACYAPELRDCTVSCARASDCATGEICGDDRLCAAPAISGHCAGQATPDGARSLDTPTVDAVIEVSLHIHIDGPGMVSIVGAGICNPPPNDCTYDVRTGVVATIDAIPRLGQQLDHWTGACANQGDTCTITPIAATDVGATFKKEH